MKRQARNPSHQELTALVSLHNAGRYTEAATLALTMTARFPRYGFGWKALGELWKEMGWFADALAPMQEAVALLPNDAEAHGGLGLILLNLGRLEEAEASYRRALQLNPDYAEAHCLVGVILQKLNRLQEAEASYRRAIEIEPDYAEAHINLGLGLQALNRLQEAEASFRRALQLNPEFAEAHNNLGNVLHGLDRLDEAQASYRRALLFKPDYAEAHGNLGNALKDLGRLDEAEAGYRSALAIGPDPGWAYSNLLFLLAYFGMATGERYLADARGYELKAVPAELRAAARAKAFGRSRREGRRLRIGYVSGDFRAHPVSYFMERILENHDRGRIELFAYPTFGARDSVTESMQRSVDHWHSLVGISEDAAAELIAGHEIDALVDLSGHVAHNRLGVFARRVAPVQCHYLGYFASTGLSEMDYWIGDSVLIPEIHERQYSEKVWRLPRVWVSYAAPDAAPEPVWQAGSEGQVCLGSFNHLGKITQRTIGLWASVLRRVPHARLLLKTKQLDDAANRDRILAAFSAHGIAQSRVELLGKTADWSAHMSLYSRLDVALDPVGGVAGGTTTCDALWMGIPVVTLAGGRTAERMTASMLAAVGCDEWAARDEEDYVAIVARLAANAALRKQLRFSLRDTMRASPLCDAAGLARALEDAYESMFTRWIAQQPLSAIQSAAP